MLIQTDRVEVPITSLVKGTREQLHLVALNFRVPFQMRQKLKSYAVLHGMTMTDVLVAALRGAGVLE